MSACAVLMTTMPPEAESYVINLLLWIGTPIIVVLATGMGVLFRHIIRQQRIERNTRDTAHKELLEVVKSNTQSSVELKAAVHENTKVTERLPDMVQLSIMKALQK